MPDQDQRYTHLLVSDRTEARDFRRQGRGGGKIRYVERHAHGAQIQQGALAALAEQDRQRHPVGPEELEALGVIVTIEGSPGYPLKLDSLEQRTAHRASPQPKWLLLSVAPESEGAPERALVWVSDEYRQTFLSLFEDYLTKPAREGSDHPRNRELVANMSRIRATMLMDLWRSNGNPPTFGRRWWELWLRPTPDAIQLIEQFAEIAGLRLLSDRLRFDARCVVWIRARWDDLLALPHTAVPLAEIRRPQFVDTIEDLDADDQLELIEDLAGRVVEADVDAPVVCLLDTGVRRRHVLLSSSLAQPDLHSVVGAPSGDLHGHGTRMASLALLGPIDDLLLSKSKIRLRHRLESVKYLPDKGMPQHDKEAYGVVTAEAIALPEAAAARRRVYCMTVTDPSDLPGEPSLWSAAVDALAAGTDIGRSASGIELLGSPNSDAPRLIIVSAGNVDLPYEADYRRKSDLSPIEDPAQAWNVLTVGASTSLVECPTDATYVGWQALAAEGDLSPHSRTGVIAGGAQWPIKPDICMEGGNVLHDGAGDFHDKHPLLSLRTADARDDMAIGSANATSAAAAQAAQLAAVAMATYPSYWPETIRGLLTHCAEWTPAMCQEISGEPDKRKRRQLLKRYGWGVPRAEAVLTSSQQAVTMVVQDEFVPFTGSDFKMRQFRLHQLPWPVEVLADLGAADVELRVTLSYFIEPSAARRGWRRRYAYASHGLRFELRSPDENTSDFIRRVNREAVVEEEGQTRPSSGSDNWTVGSNQRGAGSLHQDLWSGYGPQLARTGGVLAVHPVGGWWKNNRRKDRVELPVRYALLISLRTRAESVDLYTPIATSLAVPVEHAVIEV